MSAEVLEQPVLGSRRLSNYLVAAAVSIGGIGTPIASFLHCDPSKVGHLENWGGGGGIGV